MKRQLNNASTDDDKAQQPPTKKLRFEDNLLSSHNNDNEHADTATDQTGGSLFIVKNPKMTVHEARSSRNIRRLKGFENHSESILGEIDTEDQTGFLKRVSGEEFDGGDRDSAERITVDRDNFGLTLIEPFTLDRERQEGKFDSEGNFLETSVRHNRQLLLEGKQREKYKKQKHDIDAIMNNKKFGREDEDGDGTMVRKNTAGSKGDRVSVFDHRRSSSSSNERREEGNNVQEDEESGREEDGDEEEEDAWIEGLEEQEKQNALNQTATVRHRSDVQRSAATVVNAQQEMSKKQKMLAVADHAETVLRILQEGESVRQALDRLRPAKSQPLYKKQDRKKRGETTVEPTNKESNEDETTQQRLKDFNDLNHACSQIMSLAGDYSVFEEQAPHFQKLVEQYDNSEHGKWWTYKWQGKDDIYGPFAGRVMQQWKNQGHFAQHPIMVRLESVGRKPLLSTSEESVVQPEEEDDMFETAASETEQVPFVPFGQSIHLV